MRNEIIYVNVTHDKQAMKLARQLSFHLCSFSAHFSTHPEWKTMTATGLAAAAAATVENSCSVRLSPWNERVSISVFLCCAVRRILYRGVLIGLCFIAGSRTPIIILLAALLLVARKQNWMAWCERPRCDSEFWSSVDSPLGPAVIKHVRPCGNHGNDSAISCGGARLCSIVWQSRWYGAFGPTNRRHFSSGWCGRYHQSDWRICAGATRLGTN